VKCSNLGGITSHRQDSTVLELRYARLGYAGAGVGANGNQNNCPDKPLLAEPNSFVQLSARDVQSGREVS
jgi:hypothetical protein